MINIHDEKIRLKRSFTGYFSFQSFSTNGFFMCRSCVDPLGNSAKLPIPVFFSHKSPKASQHRFVFPPQTLRRILFLSTLKPLAYTLMDRLFVVELLVLNFIKDGEILSKKTLSFLSFFIGSMLRKKGPASDKQQHEWTH